MAWAIVKETSGSNAFLTPASWELARIGLGLRAIGIKRRLEIFNSAEEIGLTSVGHGAQARRHQNVHRGLPPRIGQCLGALKALHRNGDHEQGRHNRALQPQPAVPDLTQMQKTNNRDDDPDENIFISAGDRKGPGESEVFARSL